MKHLLLLILCLSAMLSNAQDSTTATIKASDPTQLYTFVEGYGGFNFIGNNNALPTSLDTWEVGFRGNWAIKEKFRMGVYLPMSNNTGFPRVFDDISIDLGFQIHNNSGFYNATVINAGFISPSLYDIQDEINQFSNLALYLNSSSFYSVFTNYMGALKISNKLSVYPGLEYARRTFTPERAYSQPQPHTHTTVFANAFKLSAMVSFVFNEKSFVQGSLGWLTESWAGKYGEENWNEYFSGISLNRISGNLKYQYALTPFAQAYLNVKYNSLRFDDGMVRAATSGGGLKELLGLQLGFTYFLH